jgi:hypothetical protein
MLATDLLLVSRYKKLGQSDSTSLHQSVLDYTLEQQLMADSQAGDTFFHAYRQVGFSTKGFNAV